jgi:hypothetical protein
MKRGAVIVASLALAAVLAVRVHAYIRLGVATASGQVVAVQWTTPIKYFISNVDVPGVSASDLASAVNQAFKTWGAVNGVSINPQFQGFTDAPPETGDSMTVIGFEDDEKPEDDTILGLTRFGVDRTTGALIEADIFLNSKFAWSVAPGGQSGRFDTQSIATHEVGHLLGLGHSAIGETQDQPNGRSVIAKAAVMFPLAFPPGTVLGRTLEQDDRAGIENIYGTASFQQQVGSIAGRVTLNGVGLFGAHITASNVVTGGLTGGFSLDDSGAFVISSLQPGLYLLRAEPLDDVDVSSIFDAGTVVNVNFRQTYFSHLVSVPRGGAGASFEFPVQAK